MKIQVLLIFIISIILLISCTGCDPEGGSSDLNYGTTDLTYDTGVLLAYRWIKETTSEDPEYMEFEVGRVTDTTFNMTIYSDEDHHEIQSMGIILLDPEVSAKCMIGSETYILKISSTKTNLITLSLKNKEKDIAMYFEPELITY